jgi:hypothetical protein
MLKATALKAQDVLVMCKLFVLSEATRPRDWTFATLSKDTGISAGEIHNSLARCRGSQLLVVVRGAEIVSTKHFCDLLVYATPRIFFATRGGIETGIPTGIHADPLKGWFDIPPNSSLVWPCSSGKVKGESISPIYASAPEAALKDPDLYALLALVDVARVGDTKSRHIAVSHLEKKILGRSAE